MTTTSPPDKERFGLGAAVAAMAIGTFLSPPFAGEGAASLSALLLIGAGLFEFWHDFRRAAPAGQRAAWLGGAITIAMGVLVSDAAALAATGVVVLLAEQDDEWAVAERRYFSAESMQQLTQPLVSTSQEELRAAIA